MTQEAETGFYSLLYPCRPPHKIDVCVCVCVCIDICIYLSIYIEW